jgi:hypothetical protein
MPHNFTGNPCAQRKKRFDVPLCAKFKRLCREPVTYPGVLFGGLGGLTNSVEDRGQIEWGSEDGSPLFRGSGGKCNLVQEISFHIVKFSQLLVL